MRVNNWLSRAGVLLHGRARARPTAITARAAAVQNPITVSAMPLSNW